MSGVNFSVTVKENGPALVLDKMQQALSANRLQFIMDVIGAGLESDVVKRFYQGVEPDGTPWIKSQRAIDENGQTLIDNSILVKSVTHDATSQKVTVGTGKIYGAIHQFGGNTGRNKATHIVARPWLGLAEPQKKIINDTWLSLLQ